MPRKSLPVYANPNGTWTARPYINGVKTSATFPTEKEARAHCMKQQLDAQNGTALNPRDGRITVTALCEQWLAGNVSLRTQSRRVYESAIRAHIRRHALGGMPVAKVEAKHVREFVKWMRVDKGLAHSTARISLNVLSASFRQAVEDRRIPANPVTGVAVGQQDKKRFMALTPAEVSLLISKAPDRRTAVAIEVIVFEGLRIGEAFALTVADIDFLNGQLHISKSMGEKLRRVGPTKSGSERVVPLVPSVAETLAAWVRDEGLAATDVLFDIGLSAWRQNQFEKARRGAGLGSLRVHDLRHTCASWLIQSGANPVAVQRWLGHSDIKITLGTYAHLFPQDLPNLAVALEGLRARVAPDNVIDINREAQ